MRSQRGSALRMCIRTTGACISTLSGATCLWLRLLVSAIFMGDPIGCPRLSTPAHACLAGAEQAPDAAAGLSSAGLAVVASDLDPDGVPIAGCTSWKVISAYITSYLETNIATSGQEIVGWTAASTVTKDEALELFYRAKQWRASEQRDWKLNKSKEDRLAAFILKLRTCYAKFD